MTSSYLSLALAWIAGLGLGLFYFGGLWLTVRQLPTGRWGVPLVLGSFVVRTAVLLVGLYLVMGGRWERALACLVGLLMVRLIMVARMQSELISGTPGGKDGV